MQEDEQCRLYALALSLIPDPDAAADAYMEARNEADLRRRAKAWRHRHGLPPTAPAQRTDQTGRAEALPELGEVERAFALHLARRARRRRQTLAALACLLTLVFLSVCTGTEPARLLKVSVQPAEDPAARTIVVNHTVEAPAAGVTVTIQSITVAPDYTAVRFRSDSGGTNNLILGYSLEAYVGETRLPEYGLWQRLGHNQRVTVFAPLPPEAESLTLRFPRLATAQSGTLTYTLPYASVIRQWERAGDALTARLDVPVEAEGDQVTVTVTDRKAQSHPVVAWVAPSPGPGPLTLNLFSNHLPPDEELRTIVVQGLTRLEPPPEIQVTLP